MNKIKLLHILESFHTGGAEKVTLDICNGLDKQRFVSHVLAFEDGELRNTFEKEGIATSILQKSKGYSPLFLFKLIRFIKKNHFDLTHIINGLTVINYGIMASKITNTPSIAAIHGHSHFNSDSFGNRVWYRMVDKADKIITVADSVSKHLESKGIESYKIKRIYNGIASDFPVLSNDEKETLAVSLGLPQSKFVLGCVANLRTVKGHIHLIEAFKEIQELIPDLYLLLIGSGSLKESLQKKVRSYGLDSKIIFCGTRHDVPACLQIFDIFILSSLSEGLPISILEAMRASLPIIATSVGGVPETVRDRLNGFIVEPGKSAQLSSAIKQMFENTDTCEEFGKQSKKIFLENFTHKSFISNYEKVFEEVSC